MFLLNTYEKLRSFCGHFSEGAWTCLIVIGSPGLGKSRTMAEALPKIERPEDEGARWIGSHVSSFQLYRELHAHQDRTFVLDDVDHLCRDPGMVKLLKCLCNTEKSRRVYWATSNRDLEREGIPREFETRSKVALIINEWETLNENVGALEDRGMVVRFAPSSAEVHRQVGTWFDDKRVYNYVSDRLDRIYQPSQRLYVTASSLRKLGEDWKGWIEAKIALPDELQIVRDLRSDNTYICEDKRVLRYNALTGKSRASYFRVVADLKALESVNSVKVVKPKMPPRKRASLPVEQAVESSLRKAAKVGSKKVEASDDNTVTDDKIVAKKTREMCLKAAPATQVSSEIPAPVGEAEILPFSTTTQEFVPTEDGLGSISVSPRSMAS